jgi:outer membrane protein OmpU
MKKQLLITTALVTAGAFALSGAALAGKPKLSVGGFTQQIFGVGENDDAFDNANGARTGFDQHSDTEIHFNGSVTLDNGIKIRTRTELEGESSNVGGSSNGVNGAFAGGNNDVIDETWMRISGSFGEIRLGSGDAAAQAMTTGYLGTWGTGVGLNLAFDTADWVNAPGGGGAAALGFRASTVGRVDISSDAEHVSYFTPRFSGFQAGISYVPSAQEDVNNTRSASAAADSDIVSLGLNFDRKVGGIGVGVAVGYTTGDESTVASSDPEIWGIAGRVDFSGFRVSMSHVDKKNQDTVAGGIAGNGQKTFEIGARYTFGPNAVSIQHLSGETDSPLAARDGDEVKSTFVAYRRTLGPGVSFKVTAIFADFDDGLAGAAVGTSNDGQALTTAIQVRF